MSIGDATIMGALLVACLFLAGDVAVSIYQAARWVYKHTRKAR